MQPSKVLVVDDSDLMHRMYDVMLRGIPLVHARDGQEALDRLGEHPDVDLLLLDINMPRMNGFELLTELVQRSLLPGLPVIVVTTEGRDQDAERGLSLGAAAYLKKPFRGEEVRAAITALPEASEG